MSGKPIHGQSLTPEYRAWREMIRRCYNRNCDAYPSYGGRGIAVCQRWCDSLDAFLSDMGRRPSDKHELDRENNDGGYTPDNCRWVLSKINSRNRRSNRLVTIRAKTQTVADWSDTHGVKQSTICKRLDAGWSPERAIKTPARSKMPNGKAKPVKNPCVDCGTLAWGDRCQPCENRNRHL